LDVKIIEQEINGIHGIKRKPLLFVLPCNNYVHLLIQNASSNCGSAGSADNVIGVGVCAMARK
jgi:hypothetical protein